MRRFRDLSSAVLNILRVKQGFSTDMLAELLEIREFDIRDILLCYVDEGLVVRDNIEFYYLKKGFYSKKRRT